MALQAAKELAKSIAEQKKVIYNPRMVPWCWSEAPIKVAVSICLLHCFPLFFNYSRPENNTSDDG